MRYIFSIAACTLCAGLQALPVAAATNADLAVSGTLVPAACNLSWGNGGTVDLGKISAATLSPTGETNLARLRLTLDIDCNGPMRFALSVIDQRPGTSTNPNEWSLGLEKTPAGENIGYFFMDVKTPISDGSGGTLAYITSRNNGASWLMGNRLGPGNLLGFQRQGDLPAAGPALVERVIAPVEVLISAAPANSLTLTGDVTLDGLATVELKYL